jgi:Domain of unknown function (DUF4416)
MKVPPPVKFFASIIFNDSGILSEVETELARRIGPVEESTDFMPFSQSNYYAPEMGTGLMRRFLLFGPLRERERLAEIKAATNVIEQTHALKGMRSVNIDPGYIALEQMVLGTTKGFSHRIYQGQGIYADLTLIYENGTYCSLPWTYPDYGGKELISLLNGWRERYKRTLRC